MKVLVIGSGGREHAIIRKLKENPTIEEIICAPGNGGIAADAKCVNVSAIDLVNMVDLAKNEKVDFCVVTPDDPLAMGMVDILEMEGIPCFGPNANAAIIESSKVFAKNVIEQFMTGPEVSVLAFTDGHLVVPMVSSMDHKRALDNDEGLNTGGMGTIAPSPFYTKEIAETCMNTIFLPTVEAMNQEGRPFKGCLYFGLMLTPKGPRVVEYNCRFGDPETQVVLPLLKTDLLTIMRAVHDEKLSEVTIEWEDKACACVILASGGYPQKYHKGYEISGLDDYGQIEGVTIYHAGTAWRDGKYYTNGGRVLGVSAVSDTLEQALQLSYDKIQEIHFTDMHYRTDIGRKVVKQ